MLGVDDKGKQERSKQTAESFRHLHRNMLAGCENPHAQALLTFLDKWKPEMFAGLELRESMLNSNLAFKPDGQDCFLHEIPELKARWPMPCFPGLTCLKTCSPLLFSAYMQTNR